jgi:hypothetical protein
LPDGGVPTTDRQAGWLLLGSASTSEPGIHLTAAGLSLELVGGSIREVRVGSVTVLEQAYVAVRDEAWNTIPGRITSREIVEDADGFRVRILSQHRHGAIDMSCDTIVEGRPDGSLRCEVHATANAAFSYARVGLNLVHPAKEHVGRAYRAVGPAGVTEGNFPARVQPQPIRDGHEIALIQSYSALTIELAGLIARFTFEGDLFETEDQRNFGDASFKTLAPPLDRPLPLRAQPGDVIHQAFALDARMTDARLPTARSVRAGADIIVSDRATGRLPAIGLVAASHGRAPTQNEAGRVRRVGPAFLRVGLSLTDESATLAGVTEAAALGLPIELTVEAPMDGEAAASLRTQLRSLIGHAPVIRAIVVAPAAGPRADELPNAEEIQLVRDVVSDHQGVQIVAGARTFFAEANRGEFQPGSMDGLAFPYSPAVHVWDDESLFTNLAVLPVLVRQGIEIAGGSPVHVGPVTMATRSGPFPRGPLGAGGLPGPVDPRQLSVLGAAWTVAAVAAAASGGATSLTMFETTGWLGVVELETGSQNPAAFPSVPGALFPLGYALAAMLERPRASVLEVGMEPDGLAAIALRAGRTERLVLANLRPEEREASIAGLGKGAAHLRLIDETIGGRRSAPVSLRTTGSDVIRVRLGPYAVAVIGANG